MQKTPDEIKEGLECCKLHFGDMYTDCSHCPYYLASAQCDLDMHDDALALIQQLEAQVPRWISVEERLPEEGESVLVRIRLCDATWYEVAHRINGRWSTTCITHWRPIPQPPKEE